MESTNTTQVKFYYGKKASYVAATHGIGIYFAYDTKEIILNDTSYGVSEELATRLTAIEKSVKDEKARALAAEKVLDEAIKAEVTRATNKEDEISTEVALKATKAELTAAKTELEGEIDAKANKSHTHAIADITGLTDKLAELESTQKSNKVTLAEGEKVLKITSNPETGDLLSSEISLTYDTTKGDVFLKGADGAVISTINLGLHQIIEDGKLVTEEGKSFIVLKFKGVKDEIKINVTSLIDIYTGSGAIKLTGNDFSLSVESVEGGLEIVDDVLTSTKLRGAIDAKLAKKADTATVTTELAKKADKTALDAEVTRATKKEGELDTAIEANTTAITAEETRAKKVEAELESKKLDKTDLQWTVVG